MIRPALALSIEQPAAPRYTVRPGHSRYAIYDGSDEVAWVATEALANRIAGFLNWRASMDVVERRYAEILHA